MAHEYIPTIIILLTGLLCVTKLIGMFPFDWIWVFVLIWGPICLLLAFVVIATIWIMLSDLVASITGAEI